MSDLNYFFNWPHGQVWPNLMASAIWSIPTIFLAYRQIEKKHKQREDRFHHHIDQQFSKITPKKDNK